MKPDRVLAEAFRVLKPGGRFAVSDVVVRGELPKAARRSVGLWAGCVAGARSEDDYRAKLARAGFGDVDLEVTRVNSLEDARGFRGGRASRRPAGTTARPAAPPRATPESRPPAGAP